MPMMSSAALTRTNTSPKEPNTLPPAEKLLSYQKSDGKIEKMELQLPADDDEDDDEERVVSKDDEEIPFISSILNTFS